MAEALELITILPDGLKSGTTVRIQFVPSQGMVRTMVEGDPSIAGNGDWGPWIRPDIVEISHEEFRAAFIAKLGGLQDG